MKKVLAGILACTGFTFAFASKYVAVISDTSYDYVEPTPPMVIKNLKMIPQRNLGDNWGEHRGYNYTTPIGSLTPNLQDGYRIRALSTYYKAGQSNSIVLEIDNDHTNTGLRYIEGFEVEWVGYKTLVYKNSGVYDPNLGNPGFPGWTTFRPENESTETSGLNNYLSINNGKEIDVIIKEIKFN